MPINLLLVCMNKSHLTVPTIHLLGFAVKKRLTFVPAAATSKISNAVINNVAFCTALYLSSMFHSFFSI